jgi:hypothetical protein
MKNGKAALVSKLSDSFMDNVNALLQLRNRLQDGEVLVDHFLCDELKDAVGYKSNRPNLQVLQGSSFKNVKKPLTETDLKTRIEENHIRIIK